jgi:cation:H+ antiporter
VPTLTDLTAPPALLAPYLPWLQHPLALLLLFVLASLLMIWRLHAIERKGFEGTVLGTLIMPYCSGAANLIFAFLMSRGNGNGRLVIENSLVNNVTNLTLILGLAALLSSASAAPAGARTPRGGGEQQRINRLELLFTLIALYLFTGTAWALAKDGTLSFYDGLVLVGLFAFWQVLHVFEVLKNNVRKNRSLHWSIIIDLLLIAACAWGIYQSVDRLVGWVEGGGGGIFRSEQLGWISGVLMVLPNAFLALYYARAGRQDIVVSSQIGDGHICIPMCIGLFALFETIQVPAFFETGVIIILGAGAAHFLSMLLFGRLPRLLGVALLGAYGVFIYRGLVV